MKIYWHTQNLRLRYTGQGGNRDNPGFGIEAIFGFLRGLPDAAGRHITFHGANRALQKMAKLVPGQVLEIELAFVLAAGETAGAFAEVLRNHSMLPAHPWRLEQMGTASEHTIDLDAAFPDSGREIELDFRSILPLKPTQLPFGVQAFLDAVTGRFEQLFGFAPGFVDTVQSLEVLAHLWHRDEIVTFSRSQNPGKRRNDDGVHRPRVIGRRGPLFLRGASPRLRHALLVLSALHLHKHANLTGWGHFDLHEPSRPYLDRRIDDMAALQETVASTLRLNDGLALMSAGQAVENDEVAAMVMEGLESGNWNPRPSEATLIRKEDGRARLIERFHPLDLIAQQHVLKILTSHLDRALSDTSGAFRPGRSLADATAMVRAAIREGNRFAVRADIEDCFPSIDHERLFTCLDAWLPRSDGAMRALLRTFIATPYELQGSIAKRDKGLAQGSPLSPLLTNLYLDTLDRQLFDAQYRIVRYADDILILARGRRDAERALQALSRAVEGIGLRLNEIKTAIHAVSEGFTFLGERFDERSLEDPILSLASQRKPLILTQPYLALGANGEALEARSEGRLLNQWPLRRISEIIILGRSTLSTAMLEKCARHGIPVSMALESGYQIATIAPDSRRFHDIAACHSRWHAALADSVRTAHAAQIASTKIGNYITLMRLRGEPANSPAVEHLRAAGSALLGAQNVAQIRGHEGCAARTAFQWLQTQIIQGRRQDFSAQRRERGAPDCLNSMLNFGYYLLFTRINALLRAHGLNPYLGLLHDGQDDYETLVADMQEPFRCHVDRLILRMINRQQIGPDGFQHVAKGAHDKSPRYWLTRAAITCYAEEFERMMGEVIGGVVLRDALVAQVRTLRSYVRGEGPFWLYVWKERPDKLLKDEEDVVADEENDEGSE